MSKYELKELYKVSYSTFRRWIILMTKKEDCSFSYAEYKRVRSLPPRWVLDIKTHLGEP